MAEYVLKANDVFRGKPLWFKEMTQIGPSNTGDISDAARFPSKQDASQCPALLHALSFYTIEPVTNPIPTEGGGEDG